MPHIQLGDQLADNKAQVIACGAIVDHLRVLVVRRLPVQMMHRRIVEVVSLDSPGIVKDLAPFHSGIDLRHHPGGHHRFTGSAGRCILNRCTLPTNNQKLLAIRSDIE